MPYRVLRVLEYTYDSVETADRDMTHWQIPAEGNAPGFNDKVTIRSTIIQYPFKEEVNEKPTQDQADDSPHAD